ncbi:sigma-70 family RNA polymerase sigma factor [Pseudooceanicola sp. C21-150M6]|uniref:sigma-70 family RNA polymerase sigma factor n=1 Tax=Pseudooceanicola sp. C21-150M6 TaxID=3434355 RepID=UPI003D7FFD56
MPNSIQAAMRESLLSYDEERDALTRWQLEGDRDALAILVRSHARQCWSMAMRWTDNPAHLEDLAAEGMVGLIRAADNFDLEQDVRFSTYSAWWVMNGVASAAARTRSVIDVPVRAMSAMRNGAGAEEEIERLKAAISGVIDLDARSEDGPAPLHDALVYDEQSPEDLAAAGSLHAVQCSLIDRALLAMTSEEAEIIRRRRLKSVPDSLEDVAGALRISRDRLRQMERRALSRLRQVLVENGFQRTMLN